MSSFRKRTAGAAPRGGAEGDLLLPLVAPKNGNSNGNNNNNSHSAPSSSFSSYDKLYKQRKARIRISSSSSSLCCGGDGGRKRNRNVAHCCLRCGLVTLALVLATLGTATLFVPRRQLLDAKLYLDQFLFFLEDHGLFGPPVRGFMEKDFYLTHYPELKVLEDNFATIQAEWNAAKALLSDIPAAAKVVGFKKKAFQYEHTHWRSLVLKLGNVIDENRHLAPQTLAWLETIPYVYTASFSIFESHTYLPPHWGYWKGYVRYQLAVQVPKENVDKETGQPKCWIRMQPGAYKTPPRSDLINHGNFSIMEAEGAVRYYWTEGEGVLFDDVSAHDANNESDEVRAVLYLDLGRKLPLVLDVMNKILLWFINQSPQIKRMQKMAPVITKTPEKQHDATPEKTG